MHALKNSKILLYWFKLFKHDKHHPRNIMKYSCSNTQYYENLSNAQHLLSDSKNKQYSEKLHKIVDSISELKLSEVAELNNLLKLKLEIPDINMMTMGTFVPSAQSSADIEEEVVKTVQTSFTVKLISYNEDKKISLIKEIKNIIDGINLVQAKKFVENVPAVIKSDISKDEAEKLKDVVVAAGGICEIE